MSQKIALYPGCSLEGTAGSFRTSLEGVLKALDIPCNTLDDWSCCGASSAHAIDRRLSLALAARNLELAESQGYSEILAPCAACYHSLAMADEELKDDADLAASIKAEAEVDFKGEVKVRNVLDLLINVCGPAAVAEKVDRPLTGLSVACYYGCLNTRIPGMACFDDVEYPMSMDHLVKALGAEPMDWSYKTDCCGASLFVTAESVSGGLVAKILKDAAARGADCIVVACPMCQNNLDVKQEDIRADFGVSRPLPILFISQLMGIAFGLKDEEIGLGQNFVPFNCLEQATS